MHVRLNGPTGDLTLPTGMSVLGRGHDCTLRVNDPRLSRHHARFHFDGEQLSVEDAGSTNGVLVNGDRIAAGTALKNGDVVVCGPCVFNVAVGPTRRASISELLPQPETRSGNQATEAMEPIVTNEADLAASRARRVDPQIAAALTSGDPGSDQRLNPHEDHSGSASALDSLRHPKPEASALAAATLATPPPSTPPASASPAATPAEERKRKDRTTGLVPDDIARTGNAAPLQPEFTDDSRRSRASLWRRALAGILDPLQMALIALALIVPLLASGYALALGHAGAVIDGGLPHLIQHPAAPAGFLDLARSLALAGGTQRAATLVAQLYQHDDQQPFLMLFATATVAVLAAVLVALIGLVAATVLHGGPFWHRRLRLEIVEHRTGYFLTWPRALARWTAFALLLPLAPVGLAARRAPHDLCSGCRVRAKRH